MSVLSTAFLISEHITGRFYSSQGGSAISSGAVAADTLYAVPFTVPATATYDRLALQVGSATGNARLGIYEDNAGTPGALVLDGGSAAVATPISVTISQSLTGPKKYWLAALFSGTPNVDKIGNNSFLGVSSGAVYTAPGVFRAFAYAALPNPFGSSSVASFGVAVSLRKA